MRVRSETVQPPSFEPLTVAILRTSRPGDAIGIERRLRL
jgi:hypothetical protein